MEQKKTMRLWQMMIILLLSVIMVVTMFLPAFRINSKALEKQVDVYSKDFSELINDGIGDEIEAFDEEIKEYEEETNTHISKISPFRIMTHSLEKLLFGDKAEDNENLIKSDEFQVLRKKYTVEKIRLWAIYIFSLVIIVLVLLGFLLKWNKFIPLTVGTIYGLIAAISFGYLRFALMGSIVKKVGESYIKTNLWVLSGADEIALKILPKLWSCFYSIAFFIAFIVAVLLIIVNVVSMLTGNRIAGSEMEDGWMIGNDIQTMAEGSAAVPGDSSVYEPSEPVYTPQMSVPTEAVSSQPVFVPQQPQPAPVPKTEPMGQVRCTKGAAVGQGFMLPQDRKVIVGKSPQNANLVINNQNISNIHCSIRYNPGMNTYTIKDHSMNGTFVNGVRLQKDVAIEYPAGTVLSLADGSNEITLG